MEEPSVLDYVKDKVAFWRPSRLHLPEPEEEQILARAGFDWRAAAQDAQEPEHPVEPLRIPWLTLAGIFAALFAQLLLEPLIRFPRVGIPLYGLAAVLIALAYWRGEWRPAELPDDNLATPVFRVRIDFLLVSIPLGLLAFLTFGGGRFTLLNFALWILAILSFALAFWTRQSHLFPWRERLRSWLSQPIWRIVFTPWTFLVLVCLGLVVFFRFYHLNEVPPEMVSDHAEKLLDVSDVLNGQFNVFFPRNTGREFLQFYLTAAVVLLFKTGVSFMALKIGTAIASLLTMPYIYLLGKEVGNRWVGLFAMLMAGMAYWTNMFTRIGLRFALYPLFVAPCLYYLVRGLRRRSLNDFLLSGLALGIGLHGYTSIRILPFLVVLAFVLYLIHRQSRGARKEAVIGLAVLGAISLIVFLPLLRYAAGEPSMFAYRAFTRLGSLERPLPGPAAMIFLQNLWNAITMFFWSDGEIWVHSVTFRPALDFVSAALFFGGTVLLVARYLHRRHWVDLLLLVSVPVLMMPSILSLAFPGENPSLNRTSGAIVPVFIIAAIALDSLLAALRRGIPGKSGIALAGVLGISLMSMSSIQNFDLVFNQYLPVYRLSSWNTSEMGKVIRGFADSIGDRDSAWVVGYPYWVDTRLVGINAGYPTKDYAIFPDQIPLTMNDPRPKLFILNPQDTAGLDALMTTYPQGTLSTYTSAVPSKDFFMYLVLPEHQISQ